MSGRCHRHLVIAAVPSPLCCRRLVVAALWSLLGRRCLYMAALSSLLVIAALRLPRPVCRRSLTIAALLSPPCDWGWHLFDRFPCLGFLTPYRHVATYRSCHLVYSRSLFFFIAGLSFSLCSLALLPPQSCAAVAGCLCCSRRFVGLFGCRLCCVAAWPVGAFLRTLGAPLFRCVGIS